jgi:hypothetical protein
MEDNVVKVMYLDRKYTMLSLEDMDKYYDEYIEYCKELYEWVQDRSKIADKTTKDAIYERMLSPFQYYLEDKVRLYRYETNPEQFGAARN